MLLTLSGDLEVGMNRLWTGHLRSSGLAGVLRYRYLLVPALLGRRVELNVERPCECIGLSVPDALACNVVPG
jgi:hypothetical protein